MTTTAYQPATARGPAHAMHRARAEPAYGAYLMLRAWRTTASAVWPPVPAAGDRRVLSRR